MCHMVEHVRPADAGVMRTWMNCDSRPTDVWSIFLSPSYEASKRLVNAPVVHLDASVPRGNPKEFAPPQTGVTYPSQRR
jgi:hypothetical protein